VPALINRIRAGVDAPSDDLRVVDAGGATAAAGVRLVGGGSGALTDVVLNPDLS